LGKILQLELHNSIYWNRNSTNTEVGRRKGLLILCFHELVCWSTPLCCGQPLKHTSIYFLDVVPQKNIISCIWNLSLLSFVHHMLCLHINIFILFEYMEITVLWMTIVNTYCSGIKILFTDIICSNSGNICYILYVVFSNIWVSVLLHYFVEFIMYIFCVCIELI
jgi:hypothetical protein